MSYKKAPSIKHQEKLRKKKFLRAFKENDIEDFLGAMTPGDRELFEQSLAKEVNAHKLNNE